MSWSLLKFGWKYSKFLKNDSLLRKVQNVFLSLTIKYETKCDPFSITYEISLTTIELQVIYKLRTKSRINKYNEISDFSCIR